MDEPKRITIDELRSFEGLDHLKDEEATEIIDLRRICRNTY